MKRLLRWLGLVDFTFRDGLTVKDRRAGAAAADAQARELGAVLHEVRCSRCHRAMSGRHATDGRMVYWCRSCDRAF